MDTILLDNISLDDLRRAVSLAKNKAVLEASGNITLKSVRAIAETGVDYISSAPLLIPRRTWISVWTSKRLSCGADARGAAVENVIADLAGSSPGSAPSWAITETRMIVGGPFGGILAPGLIGKDFPPPASRPWLPGLWGFLGPLEVAIAGEGELAAGMAGPLIDHGANGMAVIA